MCAQEREREREMYRESWIRRLYAVNVVIIFLSKLTEGYEIKIDINFSTVPSSFDLTDQIDFDATHHYIWTLWVQQPF